MIEVHAHTWGQLFNHVYNSTTPLKLRNGRTDILHHSSHTGGVRMSANDFMKRPTLFASLHSHMTWKVEFDLHDIAARIVRSDSCPRSTSKTLFLKGPWCNLYKDHTFTWTSLEYKDVEFTLYDQAAFERDWIKLRLFEKEWGHRPPDDRGIVSL